MKQEIGCDIKNCQYNDEKNCKCKLEKIHIQSMNREEPHNAKESMCASYKNCDCMKK